MVTELSAFPGALGPLGESRGFGIVGRWTSF